MKLFRIFVLSMAICGGARAGEAESFVHAAINLAQVVSFHYGFSTDLNSADSDKVSKDRFGGIIGASVGWNLFADGELRPKPSIPIPFVDWELGLGLRLKYLYMDTYAPTHSVGVVLYVYYPDSLSVVFPLFPFVFGAGANFSKTGNLEANGYYIEVGLGIAKVFPMVVNTDITYRINIYNTHNDLGLGTIHSLNFVWTFL